MKLDRCKSGEGGTQILWGYGCSAGNFDNTPIAKLQKKKKKNEFVTHIQKKKKKKKKTCFNPQSINFRTTFSICLQPIFNLKAK